MQFLRGRGDATQRLTGSTSPLWSAEGSRTRLPLQVAPETVWQLLGTSEFRRSGPQRAVPGKNTTEVGKEVWKKRFPFLRLLEILRTDSRGYQGSRTRIIIKILLNKFCQGLASAC